MQSCTFIFWTWLIPSKTRRKENVSSTLPRKKIGYSKVERKQWPTGLNSLHTVESLRRWAPCCFSQPVSRMLATVLEWLTDFLTGAIMESRKAARSKAVASPPCNFKITFDTFLNTARISVSQRLTCSLLLILKTVLLLFELILAFSFFTSINRRVCLMIMRLYIRW